MCPPVIAKGIFPSVEELKTPAMTDPKMIITAFRETEISQQDPLISS